MATKKKAAAKMTGNFYKGASPMSPITSKNATPKPKKTTRKGK